MPVTRSSSRSAASRPTVASSPVVPREEARQGSRSSKFFRRGKLPVGTKAAQSELLGPPSQAVGRADDNDVEGSKSSVENGESPVLVPAVLSFSFEEAKRHLVGVDTRFADVFDKMQCRPFQQLQRLHPFR
jgi:DNA-3-methyladenine glycosylase II